MQSIAAAVRLHTAASVPDVPRPRLPAPQLLRSQHATLCGAVALATQGFSAKLLITLCSMLATFAAALVLLA